MTTARRIRNAVAGYRRSTAKLHAELVEAHREGMSIRAIAREAGMNFETVRKIVRRASS